MSFYKNRNGRSFFRSSNLSGYLKYLYEKYVNGDTKPKETVQNKMTASYEVKKDE